MVGRGLLLRAYLATDCSLQVGAVERSGQLVAAETALVHGEERRLEMRYRFKKVADVLRYRADHRRAVELVYHDQDRASVADWPPITVGADPQRA